MAKRQDKPLKIDMSFDDALRHILKAKPLHQKPRKTRKPTKKAGRP